MKHGHMHGDTVARARWLRYSILVSRVIALCICLPYEFHHPKAMS